MRLKELADKWGNCKFIYNDSVTGEAHLPRYSASLTVIDPAGTQRYSGVSCRADYPNMDDAQEAAAADALRNAGDESDPAAVRAQAWLGDAAQELILGLLGSRAGLSATQLDALSQRHLSNTALAKLAPEQLVSVTLTATHAEASLGVVVAQHADVLLATLMAALCEANAPLADELQSAVARAAEEPDVRLRGHL